MSNINDTLIVDTVKELRNGAAHEVLFTNSLKAGTFHENVLLLVHNFCIWK